MRYQATRPHERSIARSYDRTQNIPLFTSAEYAARTVGSLRNKTRQRAKVCLIIAAYNEELVLKHTIESAVRAGMSRSDIYVVDDSSIDSTAYIASRTVGKVNLLTVGRSGKGLALSKVASELKLTERYEWIHIADADGEFDEKYFTALYDNLDPRYAAATGYISSLPGSYVGNFRTFEYTMAMDITRRYQSMLDLITIIPGPTSVFRSDVFEKLDFCTGSLCEDLDVTIQIHDKKLGRIKFIDTAIARTQDPHDLRNYTKQITRWNRGTLQVFMRNKMWRRPSRVNTFITYQVLQNMIFGTMYMFAVPLITLLTGSLYFMAILFLSDVLTIFVFALYAAVRTGRPETLASFPLTYGMRWTQLVIFMMCFIEVVILKKFRSTRGTWETVKRKENPSF